MMRGAAQTIEGESMSLLSDQQWELFYEAVRRFLGAETIERFAQESLGGFAALVPARQYMLFTFKGYASDRIEYDQAYTYGTAVHYMDRFLNGGYTEEDRIFSRMSLKISDCAYRDSDIIDEETLVNLRMYKEIYEKDGVHYGMRINMASEGRLVGSYSIFRPREDGDFSELELDICKHLAPLLSTRFNQIRKAQMSQIENDEVGLSRLEAMDHYGLTAREYQVAELVAKGCSDDEVAETLSITSSTARKHLYNAYAKLAVNKRSQLEALFGIR